LRSEIQSLEVVLAGLIKCKLARQRGEIQLHFSKGKNISSQNARDGRVLKYQERVLPRERVQLNRQGDGLTYRTILAICCPTRLANFLRPARQAYALNALEIVSPNKRWGGT
jgi:hypothetical protein